LARSGGDYPHAMRRRLLLAAGVLLVAVALFLWLRPHDPPPISNRIPELTALLEKTQTSAEEAVQAYQPTSPARLDNLSVPAADLLKQLPGVGKVEVLVAVDKPALRIVHLADWHFVPRELFDADMEAAHGRTLTEADKDAPPGQG